MNKPISERFSFLSNVGKFGPIFRDSNPMLDRQRLKRKIKERRLKMLGKKIEPDIVRRAIPKKKKRKKKKEKKKKKKKKK